MLPACKSGKTRTLARPATPEPGAFDSPTAGTSAASACNSPSISRSGRRARTVFVASTTLSINLCLALPFVENESMATRGSAPRSSRQLSAEAMAISATSAADRSMTTPQLVIVGGRLLEVGRASVFDYLDAREVCARRARRCANLLLAAQQRDAR